ncbi:MAG: hypothetical protein GEU71_14065 [Actinobacteria bacterium]|nr:hypothetical protein [Actinomycetota bacterium]
MRFRTILVVAVVAIVALMPSPASAAGWLTYLDLPGGHLGVGETVRVRTEVSFWDRAEADAAKSKNFHAVLVEGIHANALAANMEPTSYPKWWTPPTEMTLLGDVVFDRWDLNYARATVDLKVPEMPPGQYQLLFCDRGCQHPMGNVGPQEVTVSADALLARTARGLVETQGKLHLALVRARSDLREITRQAKATEGMAGNSVEAITALQNEMFSLDTDPPAIPWVAFAGWFVAGLAVAFSATQLRQRVRRVLPRVARRARTGRPEA